MIENKSKFRLLGIIKHRYSIWENNWYKNLKSMIWKGYSIDTLFHLIVLTKIIGKRTRLKYKQMLIKE